MNQTPDVERELRELLRDRHATAARSARPGEVYGQVRRRHRRARIRELSLVAAAAVIVAAGVPLGLDAVQHSSNSRRAGASDQGSVRGTLARDTKLQADAVALGKRDIQDWLRGFPRLGNSITVDPATVRPIWAGQLDGAVAVLLVAQGSGQDRDGRHLTYTSHAWYVRGPDRTGLEGSGWEFTMDDPGNDEEASRAGRQFSDSSPTWVVETVRIPLVTGPDYTIVIAPRGSSATLSDGIQFQPDCSLGGGREQRIPLPDGTGMVRVPPDATSRILVRDPTGQPHAEVTARQRIDGTVPRPTAGQLDTLTAQARGSSPSRDLVGKVFRTPLSYFSNKPESSEVVWAGTEPHSGMAVALVGERYAGGISYLKQVKSLRPPNTTFGTGPEGCIRTADVANRIIASRLFGQQPGSPLVIIGPAGGTLADVTLRNGDTIHVPLTGGGGFMYHDGDISVIRISGGGHQLAETTVLDGGLVNPNR